MSSSASRIAARTKLRIVILADDDDDASQIEQTLHKADLVFSAARAGGKDSFIRALSATQPDLVIASSRFAGLDGCSALKLVHDNSPGVPVIVVDGAFSEESAVQLARAGAHDYVTRDGLTRLAFAIERMRASVDDARLRRQVERDLAFNAVVLEAEHEASPDGILVVDQDAHVVSFNRRFMEMWRIPADLAASREDRYLLDAVQAQVADSEGFLARVRDLYQHPKEKSVDEITLKDGRIFLRHTTPMEQGDIYLGRVWFFHDITAYKEADRKIQEDATQFRGLVEQELAGIFILRGSGEIAYVNPRFLSLLGYAPPDVLNHAVSEFVADEDRARAAREILELTSGVRKSNQFTLSLRHKDGTLVQGTIATYQGEPAIVGVMLDISELRSAQKELERTNRVLKTLSAGNSTLVRATTEEELLQGTCRAVIDAGGYKFAWIGFAQHDAKK
jgi:PAS domain S-box-containing protein